MSRVEDILDSKITGSAYSKRPLSRVEELLINLPSGGGGGGGGGGGDEQHGYNGNVSETQIFDEADIDDVMSVISSEND